MSYTQILQKQKDVIEQKRNTNDLQTLEIRAKNITIPAQVTTYWCQSIELDSYLRKHKHHIIEVKQFIYL